MSNPIHLNPQDAMNDARKGLLHVECSKCHILIKHDIQDSTNLPACKNCGPVIWHYCIPAVTILTTLYPQKETRHV